MKTLTSFTINAVITASHKSGMPDPQNKSRKLIERKAKGQNRAEYLKKIQNQLLEDENQSNAVGMAQYIMNEYVKELFKILESLSIEELYVATLIAPDFEVDFIKEELKMRGASKRAMNKALKDLEEKANSEAISQAVKNTPAMTPACKTPSARTGAYRQARTGVAKPAPVLQGTLF